MKIQWPLLLALSFAFPLLTSAQNEPSPEAEAFFTNAMKQINVKHVHWINNTAREVNEKNMSVDDVMIKARGYAALGSMNGQDIEAIAFLVMMQASKSAQEDLKSIMAGVKAMNAKKQQLRDLQKKFDESKNQTVHRVDSFRSVANSIHTEPAKVTNPALNNRAIQVIRRDSLTRKIQPATKADIDNAKETIKNKLDSMSEMSEMNSLRLQMMMDRRSKFISTLSNIMKKISDTQNSIIQNLK